MSVAEGVGEGLPPLRRVRWRKTYRLVPSRYPPVDLFERVGDPSEWELLSQLEGLTNDRLRDEVGDIALVPPAERVCGPGASPIMAAFTHIGFPSRFSDGRFGVYYAANCFEGALAEVLYHRARFLRASDEPSCEFDLRVYEGRIDTRLHDVRGGYPEIHSPGDYTAAQQLGARLRRSGSAGVVYESVRYPSGENLGILRPSVLAAAGGQPHVVQGAHVRVAWDGEQMHRYIIMGEPDWRPFDAEGRTSSED